MKKSLIVLLSIMLVVGFSVSANALHKTPDLEYIPGVVTKEGVQVEMSGSIRLRGRIVDNAATMNEDDGDHEDRYDSRIRLQFKVRVSENTFGVLELENGGGRTSDGTNWGSAQGSTGFLGNNLGDAKLDSLFLRQAYISHQFHPTGNKNYHTGIKAGHMLIALGNGLFLDHTLFGDDAIILWTDAGPGEVAFAYVKFDEGLGDATRSPAELADDTDAYVLTLDLPLDNINISADISYVDGQNQDTLAADGVTILDTNNNLHLWNIGARGDINIAGLTIRGDLEVQTGELEAGTPGGSDTDFSGWATLVGVDYEIPGVGIKISSEFAYGSGDDDAGDNDMEAFVTSQSGYQSYTYVYENNVKSAAGATGTGLSNTWYVNVGASLKPMPNLMVSSDIYYLGAAEDVALNDDSAGADPDDNLGWEINGNIEYEVGTNILYYIEGGVLFPGDAYDQADGDSADNVYAVRHGLILKF